MNSRLEALIKRGYPREIVLELSSFTEEELEYASNCAFDHISRNCNPAEKPNAVFIGGQPGCGKTVMSMKLKNSIDNSLEIGIDNYRMYHPNYLKIEECIRKHWENREENSNDTPGNDIADFTHFFAGAMTDKLIEMGKMNKFNMILEWGMREPNGPLACMKDLKDNGYNNVVLFVATHKDISYQACEIRADIMKNNRHIIRKVPKNFHDFSVSTLPDSVDTIYNSRCKENFIDYMAIITRDNKIIWEDKNRISPRVIYSNCLNVANYINEINNNMFFAYKTNKRELQGLTNKINDLERLKQEIIYMNPSVFNILNKIK